MSEALRVAISGAAGRMGRSIVQVLAEGSDAALKAAFDAPSSSSIGKDAAELAGLSPSGIAIQALSEQALQGAQVLIDFSTPQATLQALRLCEKHKLPVVVGTTGLGEMGEDALQNAARHIAVVRAANFSEGVTVLLHLVKQAAALLNRGFDAEVIEMHHRHKVDAPSGTALAIAQAVADARGLDTRDPAVLRCQRDGQVGARSDREIGVMSLRGGEVIGEHTLYLAGVHERIELSHRAHDRGIFARGAVRAAHWLQGKKPGLYDMFDVIGVRSTNE